MKKILVLGDNEDILSIVEEVLVYENFEVHCRLTRKDCQQQHCGFVPI